MRRLLATDQIEPDRKPNQTLPPRRGTPNVYPSDLTLQNQLLYGVNASMMPSMLIHSLLISLEAP